ncbi:hypothetical protein BGW80DRAFT_1454870 [Lactifluus volemus]|nr:hypothetical protein BGW80DRAFT_1454870 [Lactifluus volemus]
MVSQAVDSEGVLCKLEQLHTENERKDIELNQALRDQELPVVKVMQEQVTLGESRACQVVALTVEKAARGEYAHAEDVGLGIEELALADAAKDEDTNNPRRLNIEQIVHKDGLAVLSAYHSRLYTIDAYAEFSESVISALMEELANSDEEDEDSDAKETEEELDAKMKEFEELMDRRPFLVNDVLLRRDIQEWEKRVAPWGQDDEKVAEMSTKALSAIASRKATANFHRCKVDLTCTFELGLFCLQFILAH